MNSDDPDGNSMSRQINRHAQFALINHEKYKYNDLCILFRDGTCLWRDGRIQIDMKKYPMTRRTRRMVQREYKKLYGNGENFLKTVLRYLVMTSGMTGLMLFWGLSRGPKGSDLNQAKSSQDAPCIELQSAANLYEQAHLQVENLADSLRAQSH